MKRVAMLSSALMAPAIVRSAAQQRTEEPAPEQTSFLDETRQQRRQREREELKSASRWRTPQP